MPDSPFDLLVTAMIGVHAFIWLTLVGNLWYLRRWKRPPASDVPDALPSLSVCIPARNEAANLRRLLPTLLSQDYPDLEVHVWDDGSDDGTWEVITSLDDDRLHGHRGDGPPPGWLGKVNALYQITRRASGDRYLFLDADVELTGTQALRRLMRRYDALPDASVASGLPLQRGAASLLVSLVPNAILTGLPWLLVRLLPIASLGALNGQCWMIDAETYHAHEPHEAVKTKVLEDVEIGRYLKRNGITPVLLDVRDELTVYMYDSFGEAWRGFRKNAYLIMGGSAVAFPPLWIFFVLTWVVVPLLYPWLLPSVFGLKFVTDRLNRSPWALTLLAPVSYLAGSILQFDSALHHWTGRVSWKGRSVNE